MTIHADFTGGESPDDIVKAAVDEFSLRNKVQHFTVFYENSIPKMRYEFAGGPLEFSCVYRLDIMLLPFFERAKDIYDNLGSSFFDPSLRDVVIRYIAYTGMLYMLSNLPVLQLSIFGDNMGENQLLAQSIFLNLLVNRTPPAKKGTVGRAASKQIKKWISEYVSIVANRRQDYLVGFLNRQPLLNIPTSVGRPVGTTKPEEKKQQESAEFAAIVEATIRTLYVASGTMPTKTAVAEALNIGSPEYRLTSFINKLTRLQIDYQAICDRVRGSQNNSA